PVKLSELEKGVRLPHEKPRGNRRRRMLIALMAFLILAAGAAVATYHLLQSQRVDLKANKKLSERVTSGNDIKQAAFDSISGSLTDAIAKPSPTEEAPGVGLGQLAATAKPSDARGEKVFTPIQPEIAATLEPPPEALLAKKDDGARQQNNQRVSPQST